MCFLWSWTNPVDPGPRHYDGSDSSSESCYFSVKYRNTLFKTPLIFLELIFFKACFPAEKLSDSTSPLSAVVVQVANWQILTIKDFIQNWNLTFPLFTEPWQVRKKASTLWVQTTTTRVAIFREKKNYYPEHETDSNSVCFAERKMLGNHEFRLEWFRNEMMDRSWHITLTLHSWIEIEHPEKRIYSLSAHLAYTNSERGGGGGGHRRRARCSFASLPYRVVIIL